jgi:hypothetical protein
MEKITGTCPGCHKKCDLATPRCHVGEVYAKTGVLPGGKKHKDRTDRPHEDAAIQPVLEETSGQQPETPSGDDRLAHMLRAVSRVLRHGEGTLDALSEEEKAQLGALLDKASAGWGLDLGARSGHHGHHGCSGTCAQDRHGHKDKHGHNGHGDCKEHKH